MADALVHVEGEVRELIRRSGLDPTRHPAEIDRLVRDAVTDYDDRSMRAGMPALADLDETVKSILDTVAGYGPLQRYFDDPLVEEIWVNSPSKGNKRSPAPALPVVPSMSTSRTAFVLQRR